MKRSIDDVLADLRGAAERQISTPNLDRVALIGRAGSARRAPARRWWWGAAVALMALLAIGGGLVRERMAAQVAASYRTPVPKASGSRQVKGGWGLRADLSAQGWTEELPHPDRPSGAARPAHHARHLQHRCGKPRRLPQAAAPVRWTHVPLRGDRFRCGRADAVLARGVVSDQCGSLDIPDRRQGARYGHGIHGESAAVSKVGQCGLA